MTGCARIRYTHKEPGKLLIVTTLFPQYDFARHIAGDKANVILLLNPGMESHSYDPTPRDIVSINESDLFIYTGDEMEVWAAKIINSLERDVNILDVSEGIDLVRTEDEDEPIDEQLSHDDDHGYGAYGEKKHKHEEHEHIYDPHIWTSPKNAMIMVNNIKDELIKIDSKNAAYYEENANNYLEELQLLDNDITELVENADFNTIYFADRFAMYYFTRDYNLNYVSAYDSCNSETEPSAKLVTKMVDEVKENDVKVIYYAELSSHKAADTIAKETGAKKLLLHSCHNVSKDEMNNGETYISLMRQNYENLKQGLLK